MNSVSLIDGHIENEPKEKSEEKLNIALNALIQGYTGINETNRCVCCGNIIPEGTMVCNDCLTKE